MGRLVYNTSTNYTAKLNPFPYQMEAFNALKDLDYAAIFHEQGLGKTKIAIDLILYWLAKRNIDTVLVVTKKQLVKNWIDEFKIHTYILPQILSSNHGDNFYILNSRARVIITNFETISSEKERIKLFLKTRNVAIVIDESTKLKNPKAKITQDFFDLSPLFRIRVIMSGTPVANRPYDLWAQIYFLDFGKSLGTDFDKFKRMTDLNNRLSHNDDQKNVFETSVSKIFYKISKFTVRETKKSSGIILPKKIYKNTLVEFEQSQEQMYDKVMKDMRIEIKKNGNSYYDDDQVALKRLLRLLEIASNPALIDDQYKSETLKFKELKKIINNVVNNNEKCIVWTNFIKNVDDFCRQFGQFYPAKVHGKMLIESRNKSIEQFKKDPNCKILFATPQAAKEGLTLTVANHVIFFDRGFNLDDYLQAQDRIHRISQKKNCFVYNLMIKDSIDVWIDKLLQAKQYAAFLAQGDISLSKYQAHMDYSYGDLVREILEVGNNDSVHE